MKTSQKVSVTVFICGLAAFFYYGKEILLKHTAWTDFQTPAGVGDIFGLFFSVTLAIGGALGINIFSIVRNFANNGNPQTRSSDRE